MDEEEAVSEAASLVRDVLHHIVDYGAVHLGTKQSAQLILARELLDGTDESVAKARKELERRADAT